MKWLLITTLGKNVGDEFARIGVQRAILTIDPAAQFELVCKESLEIFRPRPFDRAVICGMPLFWSLPHNHNQDINWWEPFFRGWINQGGPLLAVGVGAIAVNKIESLSRYFDSIREVLACTKFLSVRQPVLDHPQIMDTVCPSAFAIPQAADPVVNLCNLMPHGGHHMCAETQTPDMQAWYEIAPAISNDLFTRDFTCVAHTQDEWQYARGLGWPSDRIFIAAGPEQYLNLYAKANCYIGNRLHGAAVVASLGRPVLGIAADSRVKMVQRLGGQTISPYRLREALKNQPIITMAQRIPTPFSVYRERERLCDVLASMG